MTTSMAAAVEVIPGGSFTLSKRPRAFPSGVWFQAVRGHGPYVTSAYGKPFLDWICGLGALTVGHNHPAVVAAITRQLRDGVLFSMPHRLEATVAERLCKVIPCAEQVKVVKTGSEACSAAVRIARMATGRELVLTTATSYHGWHDGLIAAKPTHPGVPVCVTDTIDTFDYNGDCEAQLGYHGFMNVAAVILEPVQGEPPNMGWLEHLREVTAREGIVLIFDEMLCGGRLRLAGAQEYYGVTPDLATFGKALGGGLPFAFVCGRRHLMRHAWPASGTFSGDALALAAADTMLDVYKHENVIEDLWRNGAIAKTALMQVADKYDLAIVMHGHDPRFWFEFPPSVDQRLAKSVFVQQAALRGQLVHPNVIFASAAMTTQQATEGAAMLAEALEVTCASIKDETLETMIDGEEYEDSVR